MLRMIRKELEGATLMRDGIFLLLPVDSDIISEKELLEPLGQTARSMKLELRPNVQ